MADDIHACLLIGLASVGLFVMVWNRGEITRRRIRRAIVVALPFAVLSLLSGLVLNYNGTPVTEWLLPGIFAVVSTATGRRGPVVRALNVGMLLSAIGLSFHFLELVGSDQYTANSAVRMSLFAAKKHSILASAAKKLRDDFGDEAELPRASLCEILAAPTACTTEELKIIPLWHTPLTRLQLIKRIPAVVWYPGGKVKKARENLELRPL